MFKPAMGVALAAGAVLVVSGLSAGVVALQNAFQVGESPAHTIGVDAVSGEEPIAEPTPTPTPDAVEDDTSAVVPVVAVPVPVDAVAPVDDGAIPPPERSGDVVAPGAESGPDAAPDTSAPVTDAPAQPAQPKPVAAVPPRGETTPPDRTADRSPAPAPDPTADEDSSGIDRHRDGDRLEGGDRDRNRDGDRDRDRDGDRDRDRDGADPADRDSDRGARDDRGGRDGGHHRGDDRGQTGRDGSGD